jgi:hypothetical protein
MNVVRAFLNIVLNGDWLRKPRAGESRNISHGHPGEVKEILKESGDDSFGLRRHVAAFERADMSAHSKFGIAEELPAKQEFQL